MPPLEQDRALAEEVEALAETLADPEASSGLLDLLESEGLAVKKLIPTSLQTASGLPESS